MNFSQMHERLRQELLRRIQRGTVSVSLLARQTGFRQSHLSNFLHSRRHLSLAAMDRILLAQQLAAGDLMPADVNSETLVMDVDISSVPLVSHATALSEPQIRHAAVQKMLHLPSEPLMSARAHASSLRRMWQRFVAVRIPAKDAFPMEPVNFPEALAIIDRHYNVLTPYQPHRVSLYAARRGSHLMIRYLEYQSHHLILRPHSRAFPIDLIEIENGTSPSEFIVGRVALVLNEV